MTQFIKPYKGGYLHVMGSGRVRFWTVEELKVMSMAYDELRMVNEGSQRSFSLNQEPMDKVLAAMKRRRKCKDDNDC